MMVGFLHGELHPKYLVGVSGACLCQKECTSIWRRIWGHLCLEKRIYSWGTALPSVFFCGMLVRSQRSQEKSLRHWKDVVLTFVVCSESVGDERVLKWFVMDRSCSGVALYLSLSFRYVLNEWRYPALDMGNFCHFFYIMPVNIICCILAQIPCLGKMWFVRYGLKCSGSIILQDFYINYISRTKLWKSWFFTSG